MFDLGDDLLNSGIQKLIGINRELNVNQNTMNEVNQQLLREAEKLDEIAEDMKSTFGILKQANKFVTELAKDYYKDKCIVGMSILILLLIITVTIVGIVKNSKTSSTTDTTTATNTTNTTTANTSSTANTATTTSSPSTTNTATTTNATAASLRATAQFYKDTNLLRGSGKIVYSPVDMIAG